MKEVNLLCVYSIKKQPQHPKFVESDKVRFTIYTYIITYERS